ncbi:hypothetical protein T440DRAFT_501981 [Plenodomus tracheiphilus IPT5]|uniref:Rhodopsin domain-containing protein n=1 Tax=Plenodomus tracheiphilus IPT5 TaxID=1408161 RepID=A0A6A7ASG5_9PLEO|nr:hypothetical protein T440DRAFT_501981 [Plenodomus tracheiphilus IPT5]
MPGGIHPPLKVILAWPKANYVNPEIRPNTVTILACVLGPITIGMLLARLWVRIIIQRHPGWDDWVMLAATIPTIVLTFIYPLAVNNGFNKHIWDLNPVGQSGRMVVARKYILAAECIFCVASGLIKISILLFYRRLSSRAVSTTFRRVTWLSIGFIVAYTIALTLAPILGCQPISAFWDQVNVEKILRGYKFHCFDEGADVLAASIISAAQDLLTAVLPTLLYWNLRVPIRQKIALLGIFAIGYAGVAIGAIRAYYSWRIFYNTYDVTWMTWELMLTCLLELHIGAFCANAPALKVFFKHFFHDKVNSKSRTKASGPASDRRHKPRVKSRSDTTFSSVMSKLSTLLSSKSEYSRNTNGYISEPHSNISVDAHGGVQIQRDFQVTRSPRSTTNDTRHESVTTADMIYDSYYEDIELGRYTTGHNSLESSMRSTRVMEGADLDVLPPIPKSPLSPGPFMGLRTIYFVLSCRSASPVSMRLLQESTMS